ncbi:MAG: tyrosine-protein phosphatase [Collinsella intestinalis]
MYESFDSQGGLAHMVIATERRDAAVHSAGPKQLPLARVRNVRDLGGYAYRAEDGSQGETAYGIFLRGPSLRKLTPGDYEYLQEYGEGLKCVVDLRSDFEVDHWPDPYACGRDGVTYVHVQMLDQLNSGKFRDALPDRMSTVYKGLLDNHASSIRRVMESIGLWAGWLHAVSLSGGQRPDGALWRCCCWDSLGFG